MKRNKLLDRQIRRYLPDEQLSEGYLSAFIAAVNGSYEAFERDIELAERAFKISEEEYSEVNAQLRSELSVKRLSIYQLKEAVDDLTVERPDSGGDELLDIAGFLRTQLVRRKEAEAKLKASEELWQFALEGADEGVWDYNFQTREVYFSRQYKKMLGYGEDELQNEAETFLSRIHPDDLQHIQQQEEEYLTGKISSHQREFRIKHRAGHYIWVLDRGMVMSYTAEGAPLRIVGTHADITEQRSAGEVLRLSEEKYRNIIANMNLGLLEVDNDEYIQYANQRFCDLSGYDVDELTGKQPAALFAKGANTRLIGEKNKLRTHGISDAYEIAVTNKRGELKWWLVSGAPRYNDLGELVGSIGIHLDITPQKELELQLHDALESAEQSARAKETFLANMSHEIRTPMNAIMGMSRQLERTNLNSQQQFFVKTITTATDHLMVVINDILDISKIEAGKMDLERIGFKMQDLLKHTLQVIQPKADEKGLALVLDMAPGIAPVLLGDPHRLNQILLNLASNAVKFTERGKIVLSCELSRRNHSRQDLRIKMRDTGIGMDAEFLDKIFEKFTQEESRVARKYGGTGLGMAISKQLVELMGGEIQVFSEKGVGTETVLSIPFDIGTEEDIPQARKEIEDYSALKGKRILLVEDNEMNRLVATSVLENFGVIITEVVNGEEAVKAVQRATYDIILMDMQMPVMNGLEATTVIRQQLKMDIPIIALTANAIKGESDRCIAVGMNSFVSKPFNESDLLNAIAECLQIPVTAKAPKAVVEETVKPLYSLAKLQMMAPGNDDFVNKLLTLFVDQMPESASGIETAFSSGDLKTVRALAHKIKPAVESLEIYALREPLLTLEKLQDDEAGSEHIKMMVVLVVKVVAEVAAQFQKLLNGAK